MKKFGNLLIIVLAAVIVISFAKDIIIKVSVEKGAEFVTGLQLKMQSFSASIVRQVVGIKNLRLYNPKGYEDRVMLYMPEIFVDYDLGAITKGVVHVEEMRMDMAEFLVVKNERGELNLDALKVVQAEKEGKAPEAREKKGKAPEIRIDSLELKIGKVVFKDYSKSATPSVKEFNVNLNERYQNITNPYSLVSLIVVKALMNTTIANLTNFDLGGLQGTVSDTLRSAQKVAAETVAQAEQVAREAAKKTQAVVQETTKTTQKVVTETQKTVEKTADDIKKVLTSPFGSKAE